MSNLVEFDHVTSDLPPTFKVKCQRSRSHTTKR